MRRFVAEDDGVTEGGEAEAGDEKEHHEQRAEKWVGCLGGGDPLAEAPAEDTADSCGDEGGVDTEEYEGETLKDFLMEPCGRRGDRAGTNDADDGV